MDQVAAQHVLSRFGLGRRFAEPLPSDPVRWAIAQLDGLDTAPPGVSITDAFMAIDADRAERVQDSGMRAHRARDIYVTEIGGLVDRALTVPNSFRERLVWFWANHFTVSLRRGEIGPMVGDYIRMAIRPHVTGHFGDMLLAVMRHPAMLLYLDNASSVGPSSPAGLRGGKGINENLARECLELHTVTPDSGYSQADVTEFARVLTGWSVERREPPMVFRFRPNVHEPGIKQVMHHSFAEGEQGGVDALAWLAAHPATHRHLATKLVRHFVADDPPPAAVRRIEGVLRDGDLGAAARAVVGLREAWQPLTKLRSPLLVPDRT